ncbi:MAG: hypothetical protein LBC46_06365 [Treponema sp.]|jgi:hypothetical protein|nr:hypothetical protein [Treponema sp.]
MYILYPNATAIKARGTGRAHINKGGKVSLRSLQFRGAASRAAKHVDVCAPRSLGYTRYQGLVGREGLAADRTDADALTSEAVDTAKNVHDTKAVAWRVYRGADTLAGWERGGTDRTNLGNARTRWLAYWRRSAGNSLFIVAFGFVFGTAPQEKSQAE